MKNGILKNIIQIHTTSLTNPPKGGKIKNFLLAEVGSIMHMNIKKLIRKKSLELICKF